jgi:phage protein D
VLKVEYRGIDITSSVVVDKCWIDQYAEEHGDTLKIIFADADGLWDAWAPKIGDKIRVYDDHVDSGVQYVRSIYPSVGRYEITAGSIPVSADLARSSGWQQVTKLQLAKEIAARHNVELMTYGITDHKFLYLRQENEADFPFFQRLCLLEGDAFLIYDNRLILYNEAYIESMEPRETVDLDADNKPEYVKEQTITALSIRNGSTEYTYGTDTSRLKSVNVSVYIDSKGTAERYATNLYHHFNKMKKGGIFYTSPITDGYTAGSMARIKTRGMASFDGNIFICHVRHDMANNKTKVFFRCV